MRDLVPCSRAEDKEKSNGYGSGAQFRVELDEIGQRPGHVDEHANEGDIGVAVRVG